jgi:hypothetical protein
MADLTSIYISISAVVISVVFGIFSIVYSKKQYDAMDTQSQIAKNSLDLYRKELNSTTARFFLEEKREHYKKLIESMQNWEFNPYLEGETISVKPTPALTKSNYAGVPIDLNYLEQAKSHLRAYVEIWRLYVETPDLYKNQLLKEKELRNYIESRLREEVKREEFSIITEIDIVTFMQKICSSIFYNLGKKPENMAFFKNQNFRDRIIVGDWLGLENTQIQIANDLNDMLNRLLTDKTATNIAEISRSLAVKVEQNKRQFNTLLAHIIQSVTLSNYTNMKGQCDECSMFNVENNAAQ